MWLHLRVFSHFLKILEYLKKKTLAELDVEANVLWLTGEILERNASNVSWLTCVYLMLLTYMNCS